MVLQQHMLPEKLLTLIMLLKEKVKTYISLIQILNLENY